MTPYGFGARAGAAVMAGSNQVGADTVRGFHRRTFSAYAGLNTITRAARRTIDRSSRSCRPPVSRQNESDVGPSRPRSWVWMQ